jgi:hypothetical protein
VKDRVLQPNVLIIGALSAQVDETRRKRNNALWRQGPYRERCGAHITAACSDLHVLPSVPEIGEG